MRNAMIYTSIVLAIFLAWPMVFGSANTSAVKAAGTKVVAATAQGASAALAPPATAHEAHLVKTSLKPAHAPQSVALENCFKRYEREYARCDAVDSVCRMKVADQWDLCEATGVWP